MRKAGSEIKILRKTRHCEKRSDEAIFRILPVPGDCFAALAMTASVAAVARKEHQWHDRLVAASVPALGTSATIIVQMKWGGTFIENSAYLSAYSGQFPGLSGCLEDQIATPGEGFQSSLPSIGDIAPGCHLGYLINRPIGVDPRLEEFPKIQGLITRLDERPHQRKLSAQRFGGGVYSATDARRFADR